MTPEEVARAYAETLAKPANGWGQHVHPTLGRSDYIMLKLAKMVGVDEAMHMISVAMSLEAAARRAAREE